MGFYRHSIFKMLLDLNNPGEIFLSPGNSQKHKTQTCPAIKKSPQTKEKQGRKKKKKKDTKSHEKACGKKRKYSEQGTPGQERAWPGNAARRAPCSCFLSRSLLQCFVLLLTLVLSAAAGFLLLVDLNNPSLFVYMLLAVCFAKCLLVSPHFCLVFTCHQL